jgi:hypothetical protein
MEIQYDLEAARAARLLVAGWPARLRTIDPLRVVRIGFEPGSAIRPRERLERALGDAMPGRIFLLPDPVETLHLRDFQYLVEQWHSAMVAPPIGEVGFAMAFSLRSWMDQSEVTFLWSRMAARVHQHRLALVTRSDRGLHVSAAFRGRTARWVQYLWDLPVVSAEILAKLDDRRPEPNYRWSNRISALRSSGLLVPLNAYGADSVEVRRAHAEALGRESDRRPTRLYRPILYDLSR